jgi:hypothetical protein
MVSHPSRKDKDAARMGHPSFILVEMKDNDKNNRRSLTAFGMTTTY